MSIPRWLPAALLLVIGVPLAGAPGPVSADPMTPPSPAEIEYLGQLRQVFSAYRDPVEFRSDGELLNLGRFVCEQHSRGLVGYEATLVSPAIVQLALIHLCPT